MSSKFRRLSSLFENGVLAASGLLLVVALARMLNIEELGYFVTALAIWYFFECVQRIGILSTYVAAVPRPLEDNNANKSWAALNLKASLLSFLVLMFLWGVLYSLESKFAWSVGLGAVFTLFSFHFSFLRRVAYHAGMYSCSAASVLIFAVLMLVGFVASYFFDESSLFVLSFVYVFSIFISALFLAFVLRDLILGSGGGGANLSASWGMMFSGVAAYFFNNGIQVVLSVLSGASSAAVFAATRVVSRAYNVFMSALADSERTKASRVNSVQGELQLRMFVFKFMLVLAALCGVPLCLTYSYSSELLILLLGGDYLPYSYEADLWLLALLPLFVSVPLEIYFTTVLASGFLIKVRWEAALLCLASVFAYVYFDGALSVGAAILSVLWGRVWLALRYFVRFFYCGRVISFLRGER